MNERSGIAESEIERIEAIKKYNISDTPPDGCFDTITRLTSRLLNVPIAIISLSDTEHTWFKSCYGMQIEQAHFISGFCASAILSDDLYITEDVLADPVPAESFGWRFYAAAPLRVKEGFNLGTLCIIDKYPRILSNEEKEILQELAGMLVNEIELRLEARNARVHQNQLLSMAAHELKNPLTTIPIWAEFIKEQMGGNEQVAAMCTAIKKSSVLMTDVIDRMLEAARLQAKEISLQYSEVDFSEVVSLVAAINQGLAQSKKQKLHTQIMPVFIRADKVKLSDIADNLFNNAIKYSPPGSEITIRLGRVDQMAILEVEDEGPGLTEKDQEQLFLPFTRLSARPTAGENSTGLGLSIVKLLVEAHNGHIRAKNNVKKNGTTFIVEIPVLH
jgi:signal transduction histidine kinase